MIIFISGGAKSGKSMYTQRLAAALGKTGDLYYIATMAPQDGEDIRRIERHVADRAGWGFQTIEQPMDIGGIVSKIKGSGTVLIDSLTALTANEMFQGKNYNPHCTETITKGLKAVFGAATNTLVVSDEIYCDAFGYDEYTENFRKTLASAGRFCAINCDGAVEFIYGNKVIHKFNKEFAEADEKMDQRA